MFCASLARLDLLIATSFTFLLAAVLLKQQAVYFSLFCALLIGILLLYSRWKIGGITGDVCGFIGEIVEVFVLFLFVTVV
jgi:cobalamin synthase